uniref:Uncharacterized protein n=1 Tax=Paraburkholderia sprentiae WSM5005 TaxID=754502 RepID=A0A1I9YU81_9BURK
MQDRAQGLTTRFARCALTHRSLVGKTGRPVAFTFFAPIASVSGATRNVAARRNYSITGLLEESGLPLVLRWRQRGSGAPRPTATHESAHVSYEVGARIASHQHESI